MTSKDFLAQIISLLSPLILGLIAWPIARLTEQIRNRVKDTRIQKLLETVVNITGIAVASAYQRAVRPLKDPSQPGKWDAQSAERIKQGVIADVKAMIPERLQELEKNGMPDMDKLLDQLVEKSVVELKNRIGYDLPMTDSLPPIPGMARLPADLDTTRLDLHSPGEHGR